MKSVGTILACILAILSAATNSLWAVQDDEATVVKIDNVALIYSAAGVKEVTINISGDAVLQPQEIVDTESISAVALPTDAVTLNIHGKEHAVGNIPTPKVWSKLHDAEVTPAPNGFQVKNIGKETLVALSFDKPADPKTPAKCLSGVAIPPGQTVLVAVNSEAHMWVARPSQGMAAKYTAAAAPAAKPQDHPKPPDPADVTPRPTPAARTTGYSQGLSLNLYSPEFLGITPGAEWFHAQEVQMHVDPWVRQIPGFFIFDNFLEKDFDCYGGNITLRLRTCDLTIGGATGDFEGRGTQVHMTDPGGVITDVFQEFFDGDMYLIRAALFVPIAIFRADDFIVRVGPEFTYIWMQETVRSRNNGMGMEFDYHRRYEEHVYQIAGRVSFAYAGFSLEGSVGTLFGDVTEGLSAQVLVGYTLFGTPGPN